MQAGNSGGTVAVRAHVVVCRVILAVASLVSLVSLSFGVVAGEPLDLAAAVADDVERATLRWHVSDLARVPAGTSIAATLERSDAPPVQLRLEPFAVVSPHARFVLGRRAAPDEPLPFDVSELTVLRGAVEGHDGSSAVLALHPERSAGFVELAPGGPRWRVDASPDSQAAVSGVTTLFRTAPATPATLSPDVPECGTDGAHVVEPGSDPGLAASAARTGTGRPDLRRIELAVDTDHEFFQLFDDSTAAALYVAQLYAEVSHIFMRDINTRVELVFVRLWDQPDDLFNDVDPSPLSDVRDHWNAEMGEVQRDLVQLISGRRDYPFGGQAYLSSICASNGYSVVGYAVGAFPDPSQPSPFNYDIAVTAHEIGHNAGTGHTHDSANQIDDCANTNSSPRRGTIMSYCGQTWSGGNANRDLWFHTLIRQNMRGHVYTRACVDFDCNLNGVDDAADIGGGTSLDADGNGVPDECEDCNDNGTLDVEEVSSGSAPDVDGDGVPDECQPDCDGDRIPDAKEIADGTAVDLHGNGIPDECEADCDADGTPDYDEIQASMPLDKNRSRALDACEDCDADGTPDLVELGAAHSAWIGSGLLDQPLRRFTADGGVLSEESGPSGALVSEAQDLIVTPDGRVLVSTGADGRVMAFDAESGASLGDLVSGAGAPSFAAGLLWRADGVLLVAARDTDEIVEYDGTTGASLGKLVSVGADAPDAPFAMTFGPDGLLYVADEANEIRRYDATTGAFAGLFVSAADNGGLDRPRGMVFKPDGHLLVSSFGTDRVLEFERGTGTPMGPWSNVGTATRLTQISPWGVRIGPNGNVFVARTGEAYGSAPRAAYEAHEAGHAHDKHEHEDDHIIVLHLTNAQVYEFDVATGDFVRAYVGGNDHGLEFPTAFDFVPGDAVDCNRNAMPDGCDLATGQAIDADVNATPDSCEIDCDANGVVDRLELMPFGAALDCNFNGVLDTCEIDSDDLDDCNENGVADECEISDPLESGAGWIVGAAGDDATAGVWTFVDPIGTAAQPEDDHTRAGTRCFVTGQGSPGGAIGAADVDGGATTLISPAIDLADEPNAAISYWRWFSNSGGSNPGEDVFVVDVSNDDGQSWVNVETLGPTGPGTSGGWAKSRFRVADLLPPTATVRVRFIAADLGGGSIVEAAIDDFDVERECLCANTPPAPEVAGLTVAQGAQTELSWNSAGAGRVYDVLRGRIDEFAVDGGIASARCLADDQETTGVIDDEPDPIVGTGYYYLVRAVDDCSVGSWGSPPGAPPRNPTAACP